MSYPNGGAVGDTMPAPANGSANLQHLFAPNGANDGKCFWCDQTLSAHHV